VGRNCCHVTSGEKDKLNEKVAVSTSHPLISYAMSTFKLQLTIGLTAAVSDYTNDLPIQNLSMIPFDGLYEK
jgi:hypothetical protein